MNHPSSLDLEAFACGEAVARVSAHVSNCAACRAFVERLQGALAGGTSKAAAAEAVAGATQRALPLVGAPVRPKPASSRWRWQAASVAVPLAVAAAVVVWMHAPANRDEVVATATGPLALNPPTEDPGTTFKGGPQVAVIRQRGEEQARFTSTVQVRAGDRLRVEVALDREQPILAAVLGDDGSWVEMMPESIRRPGTHLSERSVKVDASPMAGTVLVGAPSAVADARATKQFGRGLVAVRIAWEASP